MKRILSIILLIATVITVGASLTSCSSPYSDEELIGVFKEKYESSYVINEYIWGEGIAPGEYDPEGIKLDVYYVAVAENAEYATKIEFIEAIKSVYVSDFVSGEINQLLFTGYGEDGPDPRYGEIDGRLSINVLDSGNANIGGGKFLTETARVKKARGSVVVFTVTYERDGVKNDYDLMMRLEDGEWKFEAPTY